MRLAVAISLLAFAAAGCGLFFEDRAGGGGRGGGAGSATGGGGAAAGSPCAAYRPCDATAPTEWAFTYAATSVEDLARGPGGRTYFAGVSVAGAPDGLLAHASSDGQKHYYVAGVGENGCDLDVCDLGLAREPFEAIRLVHGVTETAYVAWAQDSRLCVHRAGDTQRSVAACDSTADVYCEGAGELQDPSLVYDGGRDAFLVAFRAVVAGDVTCRQRGMDGGSFAVAAGASYAWSSVSRNILKIGDDVDHVRLSAMATDRVRLTGHCHGGALFDVTCETDDRGFRHFVAEVDPEAPTLLDLEPAPGAGGTQLAADASIYPAPNGFAMTLESSPDVRALHWQDDIGAFDNYNSQMSERVLAIRSLESARPPGEDWFVASGTTDVDLGSGCPFNGMCTPGIGSAFYAILMHNGIRAAALPVAGDDACRFARASGAYQLADGTIVVGGDYTCGAMSGLVGGKAITTDTERAMFLTRVPAL